MTNFPCLLDTEKIAQGIDIERVLQNLRVAFAGLLNGRSVQPLEVATELPDQSGDCIFYTGLVTDLGAFGVAASPFLSAREQGGQSPVTSYTVLLSTETGLPLIFCDSKYLTTVRTAATTLLACQALMDGSEKTLTIVGAGAIGIEHAKQSIATEMFEKITVVSPSIADQLSPRHKSRVTELSKVDENIVLASSVEDAVRASDVVMLCTDSATPVVENDWLQNAKVVTSLTTNAPNAHEVDPSFLERASVFCDYRKTCPKVAGEMLLAKSRINWSPDEIVADLPELIGSTEKLYVQDDKPKYFRSVGLGIEDIAVACSLLPR